MSKLLLKEQVRDPIYKHLHTVGILETRCYPATYYAGHINVNPLNRDEWFGNDNATQNYHKTQDEALNSLIKIIERIKTYTTHLY